MARPLQIEYVAFVTERVGSGAGDSYDETYLDRMNYWLTDRKQRDIVSIQHVEFLYRERDDLMAGQPTGARYMVTRRP